MTVGTVVLHSLFLQRERLLLIDQQVRETAAALVDSELGDLRKLNFARADAIISEELGESRHGKFFIIRNQAGEIIFESASRKVLPIAEISRHPQWLTIRGNGRFIRVLNLQLPRFPDRTLQVGLVVEEDLIWSRYLSTTNLIFLLVIITLGLIVAWFLTSTLLRPIRKLEKFVSQVAQQRIHAGELPHIPEDLKPHRESNERDEFRRLLTGLDRMIEKINRSYKLSRLWAYQMAHELKTPLALMEIEIDRGVSRASLPTDMAARLRIEIRRVTETINSFLDWAEVENSVRQKHLFANKIGRTMQEMEERLRSSHGDRLRLVALNDFVVLASPQHLEQAVLNLLINALTYTSGTVTVEIDNPTLTIDDQGSGLPQTVRERLGEPFNRGENNCLRPRHGLGLAWVHSLARLYDWKVETTSSSSGTQIKIRFHVDSDRDEFSDRLLEKPQEWNPIPTTWPALSVNPDSTPLLQKISAENAVVDSAQNEL